MRGQHTLSSYVREYPQCLDRTLTTLTAISGSITEIDLAPPLLRLLTRNAPMEVQQAVSNSSDKAKNNSGFVDAFDADTDRNVEIRNSTRKHPVHSYMASQQRRYESRSTFEAESESNENGPLSIQVAARLRIVFLDQNSLRSLLGVIQFCNVHFLSLRENRLERIEDCAPLSLLPHLTTLSLEGNPVVVLPNFRAHMLQICAWPHRLHERSSRLTELNGITVTKDEIKTAKHALSEEAEFLPLLVKRLQLMGVIPAAAQRFVLHQQLQATASRSLMTLQRKEEGVKEVAPPVLFFRTLLAVLASGGAPSFLVAFTERGQASCLYSPCGGKKSKARSGDSPTGPLIGGGGAGTASHLARQYILSHHHHYRANVHDASGDRVPAAARKKTAGKMNWEPSLHHSYLSSSGEEEGSALHRGSALRQPSSASSCSSSSSLNGFPKMYQESLCAVERELHLLCARVFELLGGDGADFDPEVLKSLLHVWCDACLVFDEENNYSDMTKVSLSSSAKENSSSIQYYDTPKSKRSTTERRRSDSTPQECYVYKRKVSVTNSKNNSVSLLTSGDAPSSSSSRHSTSRRRLVQSPFATGLGTEPKSHKAQARSPTEDTSAHSHTQRRSVVVTPPQTGCIPFMSSAKSASSSVLEHPSSPVPRHSRPTPTPVSSLSPGHTGKTLSSSPAALEPVADSVSFISCEVSSLQNQEAEVPRQGDASWKSNSAPHEQVLDGMIATAPIEMTRTHNDDEEDITRTKANVSEVLISSSEQEEEEVSNIMDTTEMNDEVVECVFPSGRATRHGQLAAETHKYRNDTSSLSSPSCLSLSASSIQREVWEGGMDHPRVSPSPPSWRGVQVERYQKAAFSHWKERLRLRRLSAMCSGYCQEKSAAIREEFLGVHGNSFKASISSASLLLSVPARQRMELFFSVWRQRAEEKQTVRLVKLKKAWNGWRARWQEKWRCDQFRSAVDKKARAVLFQRWRSRSVDVKNSDGSEFSHRGSSPSLLLHTAKDNSAHHYDPPFTTCALPEIGELEENQTNSDTLCKVSEEVEQHQNKKQSVMSSVQNEKMEKLLFLTEEEKGQRDDGGERVDVEDVAGAESPHPRVVSSSPSPSPSPPSPFAGAQTPPITSLPSGNAPAEPPGLYPSFARLSSPQAVHRYSHPYETAPVSRCPERVDSSLSQTSGGSRAASTTVISAAIPGTVSRSRVTFSSPSISAGVPAAVIPPPLPPQRSHASSVSPIVSRLLLSISTHNNNNNKNNKAPEKEPLLCADDSSREEKKMSVSHSPRQRNNISKNLLERAALPAGRSEGAEDVVEETFFDEDGWMAPSSLEQPDGLSMTRSATPAPTDLASNFSHRKGEKESRSSYPLQDEGEVGTPNVDEDVYVVRTRKRKEKSVHADRLPSRKVQKKRNARTKASRVSSSRATSFTAENSPSSSIVTQYWKIHGHHVTAGSPRRVASNEKEVKEAKRQPTKKRHSARDTSRNGSSSSSSRLRRRCQSTSSVSEHDDSIHPPHPFPFESSTTSSLSSSFTPSSGPSRRCPYPAEEVEALIDKMETYKHTIAELRGTVQTLQSHYENEKMRRQSLEAQLKAKHKEVTTDLRTSREALKRSQEEVQHLRGVIALLRRQRYGDLDSSRNSLPQSSLQQRSGTSFLTPCSSNE